MTLLIQAGLVLLVGVVAVVPLVRLARRWNTIDGRGRYWLDRLAGRRF